MPLMIASRDYERWLEPGDPQRPPVDLLRPYDSDLMKIWRVKPDVGNVETIAPTSWSPVTLCAKISFPLIQLPQYEHSHQPIDIEYPANPALPVPWTSWLILFASPNARATIVQMRGVARTKRNGDSFAGCVVGNCLCRVFL